MTDVMTNTKQAIQSMKIMVAANPAVEAELRRMARQAKTAFDRDDSQRYTRYAIQADLARHFGLDSAQREYRYYLWVQKGRDSVTGLPFAALYAVNVYGAVEGSACWYRNTAIDGVFQTWAGHICAQNTH